jgi:hypothetical protein
MSEPGGDPSSGISLGDVLRLPKRHPACRRREAQSGSCTERENLAGDADPKPRKSQGEPFNGRLWLGSPGIRSMICVKTFLNATFVESVHKPDCPLGATAACR